MNDAVNLCAHHLSIGSVGVFALQNSGASILRRLPFPVPAQGYLPRSFAVSSIMLAQKIN